MAICSILGNIHMMDSRGIGSMLHFIKIYHSNKICPVIIHSGPYAVICTMNKGSLHMKQIYSRISSWLMSGFITKINKIKTEKKMESSFKPLSSWTSTTNESK
jgi:hypothetical protein